MLISEYLQLLRTKNTQRFPPRYPNQFCDFASRFSYRRRHLTDTSVGTDRDLLLHFGDSQHFHYLVERGAEPSSLESPNGIHKASNLFSLLVSVVLRASDPSSVAVRSDQLSIYQFDPEPLLWNSAPVRNSDDDELASGVEIRVPK